MYINNTNIVKHFIHCCLYFPSFNVLATNNAINAFHVWCNFFNVIFYIFFLMKSKKPVFGGYIYIFFLINKNNYVLLIKIIIYCWNFIRWVSLVAQLVKNLACNAGDLGSISGLGRSPGEGNGYPLQYSCLENSRDRGGWQATVHGVAKSQTQLSN